MLSLTRPSDGLTKPVRRGPKPAPKALWDGIESATDIIPPANRRRTYPPPASCHVPMSRGSGTLIIIGAMTSAYSGACVGGGGSSSGLLIQSKLSIAMAASSESSGFTPTSSTRNWATRLRWEYDVQCSRRRVA